MSEHKGLIIQFSRIDSALTKAEMVQHLQTEHGDVPRKGMERLSKTTLLDLHRLIHLGLGQ